MAIEPGPVVKVACTHCEKVAELEGAVGWIGLVPLGVDVRRFGDEPLDGAFCGAGCAVSHLERAMHTWPPAEREDPTVRVR